MKRVRFMTAVLGALLFVFAGAAAGEGDTQLQAGRSLMLTAAPVIGVPLTAGDLDGRPVVVTFFASWCPPCTNEFRELNALREVYEAEELAIVALNVFERWGGEDNAARMERFLARTGPNFHVLTGTPEMREVFGNIERIPSLIVFDAEGQEVWRFVHEVNATKMSATLEEIEAVLTPLMQ